MNNIVHIVHDVDFDMLTAGEVLIKAHSTDTIEWSQHGKTHDWHQIWIVDRIWNVWTNFPVI